MNSLSRARGAAAVLAVCALGCSSNSSPTTPQSPAPVTGATALPPPLTTPLASHEVPSGTGFVTGAWGVHQLTIDPAALSAEITQPRELQAQGDLSVLSVRPFFGPADLKVDAVQRGTGTIIVTLRYSHPFDAPVDLAQPSTAIKRADLHAFDVNALVMADGASDFFTGPDLVTANTGLVVNADGYRSVGAIVDPADFGIVDATIFPYKIVAQSLDTVDPAGNYNPLANGWQGPALQTPVGYDVFSQGLSTGINIELDLSAGPASLTILTLAKYLQPKAQDPTKSNRLPVPGDPTALQYLLPEGAGDVQRIGSLVIGGLTGGSSAEISTIDVEVLDWDHGATVAAAFPNDANTGEISENSDVATISASFPELSATPFVSGAPTGAAPLLMGQLNITNQNLFLPASPGADTVGLIRVTDTQDLDDATDTSRPIVLGEGNPPVPNLTALMSSTRYQVARIFVNAAVDPTCPTFGTINATQGAPFNLDLDAATTAASHPDGIALYEIDYDNNGSWDATSTGPGGTGAGDFTSANTYLNAGPFTVQLRVTANAPTSTQVVCPLTVTVTAPAPSCPTFGTINATQGVSFNLNLDAATTAASHPDGIASYGIDYDNNATIDATSTGPGGTPAGDFTAGHIYATSGPQTAQLHVTSNAPSSLTQICPLTITVNLPQVVLDPLPPAPGTINPDQLNSQSFNGNDTTQNTMIALAGGSLIWSHVVNVAPALSGYYTYRSTDGGATWGAGPSSYIDSLQGGIMLDAVTYHDFRALSNGLPCMAIIDSGSDLGFVSALSVGATTVDWGQVGSATARGTEIAGSTSSQVNTASGSYVHPNVLPSPSNPNRVYVLATNISSTLGLHPDGMGLYLTTNATAANPTFAFVTQVDTDPATSEEDAASAVVDAAGDIHIAWASSITTATDAIMYRLWDDSATAFTAAPLDISTSVTFPIGDNVSEPHLALGPTGEPAVVWDNNPLAASSATNYVQLVKRNAGVWTTPINVNDSTAEVSFNSMVASRLAIDPTGRIHIAWIDDRTTSAIDAPFVTTFSADGLTKLTSDTQIFPVGPGTSDEYNITRIHYVPGANKMIVVGYTAISSSPLSATGRFWYRRYTP